MKLPVGLDAIVLKRNRFAHGDVSKYRVYTDAKTYTHVLASSALEAMEKAGVTSPWKIQREMMEIYPALSESELQASEETVEYRSDTKKKGVSFLDREVMERYDAERHKEGFTDIAITEAFGVKVAAESVPAAIAQEEPDALTHVSDEVLETNDVAIDETPAEMVAQAAEAEELIEMEPEAMASAEAEVAPEVKEEPAPQPQPKNLSDSDIEALLRND